MGNTFKITTWMAKEFLRHFENNCTFTKHANKEYMKDFTEKTFRPGTSINIPKPARFAVTSGATASFPDVTEEQVTLTVGQFNTSMAPTSLELTTSVMRDQWSERYIKPQAIALANQVDKDGLNVALASIANSTGTPGVTPNALLTYLNAKAIATEHSMPIDGDVGFFLNPAAEAAIVDALKGLFHSTSEIEKQYRDGNMGRTIGAKWSMDQNVATRTVGHQGGTPLVDGASQTGATIALKGWTATTGALKKGDILTFAGVRAVNPVTKLSTGRLQTFVVTADTTADGSGNMAAVPIYPSIVTSTTLQTVTGSPADGAAVTVAGAADAVGGINLLMHKDAITLACIPMVTYGGLDKCAVEYDPDTGISIRVTQGMDVTNDKLLVRCDVLYGWCATRPEWACRIEG